METRMKKWSLAGFTALLANAFFARSKTSFRRRGLILLVTFAALLPQLVFAQSGTLGSASSPVVNALGQAMGGVNVAVCGHPASGGYPCSNLATVYTDVSFTTVLSGGNPSTTDARGNWGFYVLPGQYDVEFYGAGVTSSTVTASAPCVPTSSTSCAGPLLTSTLALKPQTSDAVQYASPNGNDGNDGMSLGTAKLTILGAYNALPATGGTIYISGGASGTIPVQCTPTAGQGLGIASSLDPNYGAMPEVLTNIQWVKAKNATVALVGVSATAAPSNAKVGYATQVSCGNSSTKALVLAGISNITIQHLAFRTSSGLQFGFDSNGSRSDTNVSGNTIDIIFQYNDIRTDCGTSCGPPLDIAGGIWDEIDNNLFENNGINNGISAASNLASGVFLGNGGSGGNMGLIYLRNNDFTGGGGVRFDANTGVSGSIYISSSEIEGAGTGQPLFEIINSGSYSAVVDIQGGFSDYGISPPIVRVATGNDPCNLSVRGINQAGQVPGFEGPMTFGDTPCPSGSNPSGGVSSADNGPSFAGVIPAAKNQRGGMYGLQLPQVDEYRRSFAPSFVRFANLAAQNPASWTTDNGTGQTLTQFQGPGDPSGVTNAAKLDCTANGPQGCDYAIYNNNLTFNAGDYIYIGAWVQPASTAGFASNGPFASPITLTFVNNAPTLRIVAGGPVNPVISSGDVVAIPYRQTDGNWQWVWALAKVTQPFGAPTAVQVKALVAYQAGFPVNVYAPMFVQIPATSVALVSAPTFSSASESGNSVTVTTTAAHKFSIGMPIELSQCSIAGYNGEFVINAVSSTTFAFYDSASGLGSPAGCVISPSNDSEAVDWAQNLASYGDNCASGALCGIRGVSVPKIVASGTSTLGNSAIASGSCATVISTAASGVLTSDRIEWAYASAPGTADGLLTLSPYVTSANVNWKLCNPTASSQTPSGLVVNWEVLR
jgi:hypothetical protein